MLNSFCLLFTVCLSEMVDFGGFGDLSCLLSYALFLYLSFAHFVFNFFCVSKPVKVY